MAVEAYELTTKGGSTDFGAVIAACESVGPYCLIGGLAVNCYVEPVYTLDADLVVVGGKLPTVTEALRSYPVSDLRVQFTTDPRYETFPSRAIPGKVLGVQVRIACLEDLAQGKLWAWGDSARRLVKRKKDELDLIRLAEAYPHIKARYPDALRRMMEQE